MDWKKMLTNDVSNRDLTFKIYKQLTELNNNNNNKKESNQKKNRRPTKQTFLQRRHSDGQ